MIFAGLNLDCQQSTILLWPLLFFLCYAIELQSKKEFSIIMIDIAALDKDTIDLNSGPLSLPKQIAEDVARRILAGEVTSGQRLNEIELAHRYGVSRGPIRDAIRELTLSLIHI